MRDQLSDTPYSVSHTIVRDEPVLDRAFHDLGGDIVVKPPAETSSLAVRPILVAYVRASPEARLAPRLRSRYIA
ncbi:hypothetical protein [Catellatospora sichuanensis]|uniref:hypothetical protein n=1 Tax=Catellatospora sichuanensis TaxID=1969805 RepID=UPI001183B494|nr:hypothetical protein [Catellatospora sichuanensis]